VSTSPESPTHFTHPPVDSSDILDHEVAGFMTPGVVSISEHASVEEAAQALAEHRVHAVLVVDKSDGTPLGWVTARGLLDWIGRDRALANARDAMTEEITAMRPTGSVGVALYALRMPGVHRLLIRRRPELAPEGVLTEFDLAVLLGR
jgi:CBS domain-containing protein